MIRRPEMLNRRAKPSALLIVMSAVLIVFAVIVLLDSLRGIFMFTVEIKGSSMLNTFYGGVSAGGDYEGGDIVYALRSFSAERGDVVIIDTTASDAYVGNDGTVFTSGTIIKRLIAVEGDSVKCERGVVYVKEAGGEYAALDEPYALMDESYSFPEVTVGEGQIFFLGDNRLHSQDSQEIVAYGYDLLDCDSIIGVVPEWAIAIKDFTTGWERFRASLGALFS